MSPPRIARPDEAGVAIELLVDSFYNDPTWSWVFPDPDLRRGQQRVFWRALVMGTMRHHGVWLTEGDTATAVWVPPGETELNETESDALIAELTELLGDEAPRVLRVMEAFDNAHPHHEPHYTLSLLGTSTVHRGHGYGLQLLADTLTVVDAAGMPAYLEASNPANVALYQRYGFELFGSFALPGGGADVATMWRPARAGT